MIAVEMLFVGDRRFAAKVQDVVTAQRPYRHFEPAVQVTSTPRRQDQVIAITGRTPTDFAVERLGPEAREMLGNPIDRLFDPIGQLQTIPRMEPLELFLGQVLCPGRFILELPASLATLNGRFQSLFEVVAHGLGITASLAFGAPALRDRIAGNRIRQATLAPRMNGLISPLIADNRGYKRR